MSITRLQQARQLYALGKLVEKRIAFGGGGSQDHHGGQYQGGHTSSKTSSQSNTNTGQHNPHTNSGYSGSNTSYGPPEPVDYSKVSQFSEHGKNKMIENLQGPSPLEQFGSGIKDYMSSGGIWGAGLRGAKDLFTNFTSMFNKNDPFAVDWDMSNYYEQGIDIPPSKKRTVPPSGPNDSTYQMPLWAQLGYPSYEAWLASQNNMDDVDVDVEETDFKSRYLQNEPEDIRTEIEEKMKDFYTV